jgi:cell division protein FtsL
MKKNAAVIDVNEDGAPAARKPWRGVGLTLGLIVVVVLVVSLYRAKTEAQETRRHIAQLEKELRETRRAISEREAEIAFLERPERLREIARARLNLTPVQTGQLKSLDELEDATDQKTLQKRGAETSPSAGAVSN